ncbi:protein seele [Neocloeon triangulifer]|uniref:protein seele n=1 Tax=Neocloeon triangulifer TaxID=2078957 RepID=UPI00286F8BEF|nr:protein seele [Neocloeon triangulifer]
MKTGVLLLCFLLPFVSSKASPKQLKCLVCRALVKEIDSEIKKANPEHTIEVGSYRLDSKGDKKQRKIQYARSELHMSEVLDNVCKKFEDYVQGAYKSNKQPTIFRIITEKGTMNPIMNEVDIVPDPDLNKGLKYYCETIVEEHDEDILRLFTAEAEDLELQLCSEHVKACEQGLLDTYEPEAGHEEL